MKIKALVVGATGIAGRGVSQELLDADARVHGLSRHRDGVVEGVEHVGADLLDSAGLTKAVDGIKPSHVYLTAWSRRANEEENIKVNAGIVQAVLQAVVPARSVKHVALVTGLKHYLGPFEAYVRGGIAPPTPLREEQPRLDLPNFYYSQEDELYAAAKREGFTWSVHRPHTIIGKAIGIGYPFDEVFLHHVIRFGDIARGNAPRRSRRHARPQAAPAQGTAASAQPRGAPPAT